MVNIAILIGNLGHDPETRYTQDGTAVTNFNMATSEKRKNKSGELQEKTEWHKIITFGRLAEICAQYLQKGSLVFIQGRTQTRSWEDKEGVKRSTTEVIADKMQILARGRGAQGQSEAADGGPAFPADSDDDVPF